MTSNTNVRFMRPHEENDQLGGVKRPTAAGKMGQKFFLFHFLLLSRAILERSGAKSVLSGELDGAERCGEVLSTGAQVMDSSTNCER